MNDLPFFSAANFVLKCKFLSIFIAFKFCNKIKLHHAYSKLFDIIDMVMIKTLIIQSNDSAFKAFKKDRKEVFLVKKLMIKASVCIYSN